MNELYNEFKCFVTFLSSLPEENFKISYPQLNYLYHNNKNYIQDYPLPVVTYNKIDIGFNLNEIFFETFIDTEMIENIRLEGLEREFDRIELYGGNNCNIDFYSPNMKWSDVIEEIKQSNEKSIGISGYLYRDENDIANDYIIRKYNMLSNRIK